MYPVLTEPTSRRRGFLSNLPASLPAPPPLNHGTNVLYSRDNKDYVAPSRFLLRVKQTRAKSYIPTLTNFKRPPPLERLTRPFVSPRITEIEDGGKSFPEKIPRSCLTYRQHFCVFTATRISLAERALYPFGIAFDKSGNICR